MDRNLLTELDLYTKKFPLLILNLYSEFYFAATRSIYTMLSKTNQIQFTFEICLYRQLNTVYNVINLIMNMVYDNELKPHGLNWNVMFLNTFNMFVHLYKIYRNFNIENYFIKSMLDTRQYVQSIVTVKLYNLH